MILFDTETTGFAASVDAPLHIQPKIIELFALKLDDATFEVKDQLSLLIDPKQPINEEITSITTITDEMVRGKGEYSSHFQTIANFWLGEKATGGHNVTFDCDMMEIEAKRLGRVNRFPWSPIRLCSVELSEHYQGRRLKLIDLHMHLFGVGFEKAHRAEPDVWATHRCFVEMKKRGDIPNF